MNFVMVVVFYLKVNSGMCLVMWVLDICVVILFGLIFGKWVNVM